MPWVRIDDGYADHPKMAACGPLGQALWLAGLAYCNRHLTDGFIPWSAAHALLSWSFLRPDDDGRDLVWSIGISSGTKGEDVTADHVIEMLLRAGVWEQTRGGYRVHDFDHYQPTKAQVVAEREAKAAAGKAGGLATAKARGQAGAAAKSKPVPVPNPVPISK